MELENVAIAVVIGDGVIVRGGDGADVDIATYDGNMSRYDITRDHGKTIVRSLDNLDDIDTLINVESIRFGDQVHTVQNDISMTQIATLYHQVLDRQADLGGFQFWSANC